MKATKQPQINATVDFDKGRGYGPMGAELPENFLQGNRLLVCSTISMLYAHPNVEGTDGDQQGKANKLSQSVSILALYAGGVAVTLTTQQFRLLERRVRLYASYMRAEQYAGTKNLAFANYVLKHAVKRAKADKVI